MHFNIDSIIFIGFLAANLVFGLFSSRGVKNIKEYAIGDRNFSTATIVATIVATWASGSFFFTVVSETYKNGLYYIWAHLGSIVSLLTVAFIYAPRMHEFLGKLSVADAMGSMYGDKVRVITAIAGFIGTSGYIGVQLKVAGSLFEYCFDMPTSYGIVISATIITFYSALGGIRSVTFTDIVQLITFGTIIPTVAFFIFKEVESINVVSNTLLENKLFDFSKVFDFSDSTSFYYLFLFIYIATPSLSPPVFQRITMAKNVLQTQKSFFISAIMCFFLTSTLVWVGVLTLSSNPNLDPKNITKHILFNYSYAGLKGLTLAGIMAMVMSTVDSFINSSAVLFVHDFCGPLKLNFVKNQLTASRIASAAIGIIAVIFAIFGENLLKISIFAYSFYMPIVTVPFMLSIVGFRSTSLSVLNGMGAGLVTVLLWKGLDIKIIDPIIPGMVANALFLFSTHYLFKQKGGWIKIAQGPEWQAYAATRKIKRKNIIKAVKNFSFTNYLKINTPKTEGMYIYVGFFSIIAIYATMHTLPKHVQLQYPDLTEFILSSCFFASTALLSYPLWLKNWKGQTLVAGVIWNTAIFYVLMCSSFAFVLISGFAQVQVMIFMINLIIVASLLRWQWALLMLVSSILITTKITKFYIGIKHIAISEQFSQFQITYLLLLMSGTLVMFIKPKQDYQEIMEEKNDHLTDRLKTQDQQLNEALGLRAAFIRNVNHEYNTPMTGITSMAQGLLGCWQKLPPEKINSYLETIYKSAMRLESFDNNINLLSKLSQDDYKLEVSKLNVSLLIQERLDLCRKLYQTDASTQEFITELDDNIFIYADEGYIVKMIDNLIVNAITYCKAGAIKISAAQHIQDQVQDQDLQNQEIHIIIKDQGVGIPPAELENIFKEFIVSTKTYTPAGGRGVGLALCRKVAQVHNGRIFANSDGSTGATFTVILPVNLKVNLNSKNERL